MTHNFKTEHMKDSKLQLKAVVHLERHNLSDLKLRHAQHKVSATLKGQQFCNSSPKIATKESIDNLKKQNFCDLGAANQQERAANLKQDNLEVDESPAVLPRRFDEKLIDSTRNHLPKEADSGIDPNNSEKLDVDENILKKEDNKNGYMNGLCLRETNVDNDEKLIHSAKNYLPKETASEIDTNNGNKLDVDENILKKKDNENGCMDGISLRETNVISDENLIHSAGNYLPEETALEIDPNKSKNLVLGENILKKKDNTNDYMYGLSLRETKVDNDEDSNVSFRSKTTISKPSSTIVKRRNIKRKYEDISLSFTSKRTKLCGNGLCNNEENFDYFNNDNLNANTSSADNIANKLQVPLPESTFPVMNFELNKAQLAGGISNFEHNRKHDIAQNIYIRNVKTQDSPDSEEENETIPETNFIEMDDYQDAVSSAGSNLNIEQYCEQYTLSNLHDNQAATSEAANSFGTALVNKATASLSSIWRAFTGR